MSTEEQHLLKETAYNEAQRYLENARETYKKAGKAERFFKDAKYVKGAAHYAYTGVLLALDAWLKLQGIEPKKKQRKSIDWYTAEIAKRDKKLLTRLQVAYAALHLSGAYDGSLSVANAQDGMKTAEEIIEYIRP